MSGFLANFSLKLRMTLVVGIFTILVGGFAYTLLSEWKDAEYFSRKELFGTEFYRPALELLQAVQLHRGNALQVARGKTDAEPALAATANRVEAALAELQQLEKQYRSDFTLGNQLVELGQQWHNLKDAARTLNPAAGFEAHTRLIESVLTFIEFYSDQSNLTLDPEVDTFYLMQLVSFTLPRAIEASARLRGELAGAVAQGNVSDTVLRNLNAAVPIAFDKVNDALRAATKANESVGGVLAAQVKALSGASQRFNQRADEVLSTGRSSLSSLDLFAEGTRLVDAGYQLSATTVPELQRLLKIRIDNMQTKNQRVLMLLIVAFSIALLITILVIRDVVRKLGLANQHLSAIRRGNLDNQIQLEGSDELAYLMRGISEMQGSLRDTRQREQIANEEARKAAEEASRIAAASKRIADALEVCDTSVMLADDGYNITFMNQAVVRMLSRRETELGKTLPGFSVKNLLGKNMDVFHKTPPISAT